MSMHKDSLLFISEISEFDCVKCIPGRLAVLLEYGAISIVCSIDIVSYRQHLKGTNTKKHHFKMCPVILRA